MDINLQSTFPPGYLPGGIDLDTLDAATRTELETTGLKLETALKLIGLDLAGMSQSSFEKIYKSMLPEPSATAGKGATDGLSSLTPQTVSIDIYSVMALFQKCAQEMRSNAREVRNSEMQAQVTDQLNAAEQIRDAAAERFKAAQAQGWTQIIGGTIQAGMGTFGAIQGSRAINTGVTTNAGMSLKNQADFSAGIGQGLGQMTTGTGNVIASYYEKAAAEHDAQRAELDASAKVHEASVQHANDLMQQMMDIIRDVREKLGAIDQARNETVRAIARNV